MTLNKLRSGAMLIALGLGIVKARNACDAVELSDGVACRCSSSYCDDIEPSPPLTEDTIVVYTSNEDTGELLEMEVLNVPASQSKPFFAITIELDGSEHQEILGFGSAFTDAAAYVISFLPDAAQEKLMETYFSRETGAKYTVGRVPVGSADFSRVSYSLVPNDDLSLSDFAIMDDNLVPGEDYKLTLIQRAQQVISETMSSAESAAWNALNVFGSVWSIPVWMKTCESPPAPDSTNDCEETSFLLGGLSLDENIRSAYANYWLKFIQAYDAAGVQLWGLTAQNEPDGNPTGNKWENTNYQPHDLVDFVETHLGPTVKEHYPDLKIMVGDDQYPFIPEYVEEIEDAEYIDGIGYHWYFSFSGSIIGTSWLLTDLIGGQIEVSRAYEDLDMNNQNGNKFLLMTEACTGYLDNEVKPGSWERGYNYFTSILHELDSGAAGWVDWNMALDMTGGPNHAGNQVDAPILVDTDAGIFYKQPMYYAMAHFSAFIPPGAVRLGIANIDKGFRGNFKALEVVAFRKSASSDECVMVIANDHLSASLPVRGTSADNEAYVKLPNGKAIVIDMPDNTFKTLLFKC